VKNKPRVRIAYFRPVAPPTPVTLRYRRGIGFEAAVPQEPRPAMYGGQTVAFVDLDGDEFEVVAECSVKDRFSYARGRTIVLGRMRKLLAAVGKADDVLWPGQEA